MDFILQNTVEYDFYKAYARVKAITTGFTAQSTCVFSNQRWVLACSIMVGIETKKDVHGCLSFK